MDHAAHGNPPGVAGHGMMWHWGNTGGHWHWVPELHSVKGFDQVLFAAFAASASCWWIVMDTFSVGKRIRKKDPNTAKHHLCHEPFGQVQIHADGNLPFDCEAGFSKWQTGWSSSKKQWCCTHMGIMAEDCQAAFFPIDSSEPVCGDKQ